MENGNLSIMPVMMKQTGEKDFRPAKDKELLADNYIFPTTGLTKREYFAAKAMQATDLEAYANKYGNKWADEVAKDSVQMADALLRALEEK